MRRTKIVATLGPATSEEIVLADLLRAGVDVVRLNFSHGTAEEHGARTGRVRDLAARLGRTVAVMQDLQGPKVRLGTLAGGEALLQAGSETVLVPDDGTPGSAQRLPVSLLDVAVQVQPGDSVLVNDGLVRLRVLSVEGVTVRCRVVDGGPVSDRKGVNLPGVRLSLPCLTEKDRADLVVGVELEVDLVALSFVRRPEDLTQLRGVLADLGSRARVVAKIETLEALASIPAIVDQSDAIMVARGDLGVELPPEEVPRHQKAIVRACRARGRAVIIATQMLESMVEHPRPTRAEASDVANAVEDGASALMLSAETSVGVHPVAAVETMARIARAAETDLCAAGWCELPAASGEHSAQLGPLPPATGDVTAAISHAAVQLAVDLGARAILTPTQSGATPRFVSRFRPQAPIVAVTPDPVVQRQLALEWGVVSLGGTTSGSMDDVVRETVEAARDRGVLEAGELAVVTGGFRTGTPGSTDFIKVERIAGADAFNGAEADARNEAYPREGLDGQEGNL